MAKSAWAGSTGLRNSDGFESRGAGQHVRTRGWLRLFVLLLAAGCSDTADRVSYRLALVGSDTLPVILQREPGCLHVLTDAEVAFTGRQQYESTFRIERRCAAEPLSVMDDPGTSGTVQMVRDTAYFLDAAGQRTGFGILTADTLVVQGEVHLLRYHRVRRASR
jgi:hypothetical protein